MLLKAGCLSLGMWVGIATFANATSLGALELYDSDRMEVLAVVGALPVALESLKMKIREEICVMATRHQASCVTSLRIGRNNYAKVCDLLKKEETEQETRDTFLEILNQALRSAQGFQAEHDRMHRRLTMPERQALLACRDACYRDAECTNKRQIETKKQELESAKEQGARRMIVLKKLCQNGEALVDEMITPSVILDYLKGHPGDLNTRDPVMHERVHQALKMIYPD